MMSFREFCRERVTWFDRLLCAVFGHRTQKQNGWSALDLGGDRREMKLAREWCPRCTEWLP